MCSSFRRCCVLTLKVISGQQPRTKWAWSTHSVALNDSRSSGYQHEPRWLRHNMPRSWPEDREIATRFLAEAEILLSRTETFSGTYPKCTGVISLKAKRPARETDFTTAHGEEVIMRGAISPLPHTSSCGAQLNPGPKIDSVRRTGSVCDVVSPDGADYVISLFFISH